MEESEVREVDRDWAMKKKGRNDRRRQRGNGNLIVWILSRHGKKNCRRYSECILVLLNHM